MSWWEFYVVSCVTCPQGVWVGPALELTKMFGLTAQSPPHAPQVLSASANRSPSFPFIPLTPTLHCPTPQVEGIGKHEPLSEEKLCPVSVVPIL